MTQQDDYIINIKHSYKGVEKECSIRLPMDTSIDEFYSYIQDAIFFLGYRTSLDDLYKE
jgi:hypothetical protein